MSIRVKWDDGWLGAGLLEPSKDWTHTPYLASQSPLEPEPALIHILWSSSPDKYPVLSCSLPLCLLHILHPLPAGTNLVGTLENARVAPTWLCAQLPPPGPLLLGSPSLWISESTWVGPKLGKIPRTFAIGASNISTVPESLSSFFLDIIEHPGCLRVQAEDCKTTASPSW